MSGDKENVSNGNSFEDSVAELRNSVTSRGLRRSGSCNSSVMTSASNWSIFMKSASFVTLNPWNCCINFRRAKLVTVEPVLFLYMFASFLFTQLTQQYYFNRYGQDFIEADGHKLNGSVCLNASALEALTGDNSSIKLVVDHSTLLAVYCSPPYRLLSLIVTLILGPISDYLGRRPVMIVVFLGAIIQGVCALCIVHFNLNLYFFILAYGMAGITGGLSAILMATFAYISDISSVKWRTLRIGIAESMLFLAGVLSSSLGGWWFKKLNCRLRDPLILIIACNATAILYILIFLPPSMLKEERRRKNGDKTSGRQIIIKGFKIIFCAEGKYKSSVWMIWVILISMLVVVVNLLGSGSVNIFFLKALDWGSVRIGAQIATSLSSRVLALMIVLPILVSLKTPDALISLIGAVFNFSMNLFMGLSHKTYQVFIVAIVQGLDGLFFPPMRGLLSKLIAVEDQGALFSIITSWENLGMMIGEVAFPLLLPISLNHNLNPGMAYIAMAALGLVPLPFLCILLVVWCKKKRFKAAELPEKPWDQSITSNEDDSEVTSLLSVSGNTLYSNSSALHKSAIN